MTNKNSPGGSSEQSAIRSCLKELLLQTDREHMLSSSRIIWKLRNHTGIGLSETALKHYLQEFKNEGFEIRAAEPNAELNEFSYYYVKMQPAAATTDCKTAGESNT